jgi:hypothetical protein
MDMSMADTGEYVGNGGPNDRYSWFEANEQ